MNKPQVMFQQATKRKAKAKIALEGVSGSGKTYTGLLLCRGLAGPEGSIAVVDTEGASASIYADLFRFDVVELDRHRPEDFAACIDAAAEAGYDAILLDSLSHEWNGNEGCLELVEAAKARYGGNSYAAWNDVTPRHQQLIEKIVRAPIHLVATMRSKADYLQTEDDRGRKVVKKVGMAPVQRDGMEFEFSIVGRLDLEHNLVVEKTRLSFLDNEVVKEPGPELGEKIRAFLEDGEDNPELRRPSAETLDALEEALDELACWAPDRADKARAFHSRKGLLQTEANAQRALEQVRQAVEAEKERAEREAEREAEAEREGFAQEDEAPAPEAGAQQEAVL